ncbi:MAG: aminopeptidase [Firmicutes bacterium]|nr:aminopeptidase [Bacillota bacterium]
MENKNAWDKYKAKDLKDLGRVCEGYKAFLSKGKTERECVELTVDMVKKAGYKNLDDVLAAGKKLKKGNKVYAVCMEKTLALFQMGEEPLTAGMNILGAHIDSPRADVKQNPLYETDKLTYLDTHYYGGIKKYQWVAQPMAIHGVVCLKDGKTVKVTVGDDPKDPVFCFTDLLIHLARQQMTKNAAEVVTGENLDLLIGGQPLAESKLGKDEKDAVKANILAILKKQYGIEESDFLSAELTVVPAGAARDLGFDRSMVLAYGQDDKVCAYTSVLAMLDEDKPLKRTSCCLIVDKEEIGSVGATGMQSFWFENVVSKLAALQGYDAYAGGRDALANSFMLSSDVSAGYDPLYAEAFERKNAAFLGNGMAFNKFTGSGGKGGSNDANAEFVAKVRKVMDDAKISYQFCELGKVDFGGGGTIAYIMAKYGMNVIDSGVPVLSMHAPYEVTSKADIYEAYKGYRAFLRDA